jgi:hypothetical protein
MNLFCIGTIAINHVEHDVYIHSKTREVRIVDAKGLFPELIGNKNPQKYAGTKVEGDFFYISHEGEYISIRRPQINGRMPIVVTMGDVEKICSYLEQSVPSVGYECLSRY